MAKRSTGWKRSATSNTGLDASRARARKSLVRIDKRRCSASHTFAPILFCQHSEGYNVFLELPLTRNVPRFPLGRMGSDSAVGGHIFKKAPLAFLAAHFAFSRLRLAYAAAHRFA